MQFDTKKDVSKILLTSFSPECLNNYSGDRGRTDTSQGTPDFESGASANSATPPYYNNPQSEYSGKGGDRI